MAAQPKQQTTDQSTLKRDVYRDDQEATTVVVKQEPEKELLIWQAPARPFKRRDREFWITIMAIGGITALIFFVIEGVMPVILIISLIFLFYILSTVEPDTIEYKITNRGVKIADKRTDWDLLTRFWFDKRFDSELLVFEMLVLPSRLELVINSKDKESIKNVISNYIFEEEASPSSLDKAANWLSTKLPGNR